VESKVQCRNIRQANKDRTHKNKNPKLSDNNGNKKETRKIAGTMTFSPYTPLADSNVSLFHETQAERIVEIRTIKRGRVLCIKEFSGFIPMGRYNFNEEVRIIKRERQTESTNIFYAVSLSDENPYNSIMTKYEFKENFIILKEEYVGKFQSVV